MKIDNKINNKINNKIDNKNESNDYVLPRAQCKLIYNVSYIFLFMCIYKIITNQHIVALNILLLHFTSILYWRKAYKKCIRRYMDIILIFILLSYSLSYCILYRKCLWYVFFQCFAILSYIISTYYYNKLQYWKSTYWHCMVHIFCNIALYFAVL